MTDDDEDAEIIGWLMMPWWRISSNITPKSYSFSIIPCALFPTRTLWLKWWTWRHHYQTRKDIRARVVHQLVTKQHRQSHNTQDKWSTSATEQRRRWDILVCPEKYRTRGSIQESSRSLFTYSRDIRNQYDFCTPTQWRSMLSGLTYKRFLQHLISSYAELYTHSMEKNWQKTLPRYRSKALDRSRYGFHFYSEPIQ
jgi:hypothetical protein